MSKKIILVISLVILFLSIFIFLDRNKNFSQNNKIKNNQEKKEINNKDDNKNKNYICDDYGRIFKNEKEAKKYNQNPGEYGATYCQYYQIKSITPFEYQKKLKVGMDVDWAKTPKSMKAYDEDVVKDFKSKGFSHVRIRVRDYNIKKVLPQIKRVVSDCLRNDLIPVLAFKADNFKKKPNEKEIKKFVNWWKVVSSEMKNYSQDLSFDLIIEVTDDLNKKPEILNQAYEKAVKEIRKTNPQRNIFISPVLRSAPEKLKLLKIPTKANNHILAEFHFDASGPSKTNSVKKWTTGTEEEKNIIRNKIKEALKWQEKNKIPVWVGAWMAGNYNKGNDYSVEEQIKFASFVSEELKKAKIPFSINSDHFFYNYKKMDWNKQMEKILDIILK